MLKCLWMIALYLKTRMKQMILDLDLKILRLEIMKTCHGQISFTWQ